MVAGNLGQELSKISSRVANTTTNAAFISSKVEISLSTYVANGTEEFLPIITKTALTLVHFVQNEKKMFWLTFGA